MEMGGESFKNLQSGTPCYSMPRSNLHVYKTGVCDLLLGDPASSLKYFRQPTRGREKNIDDSLVMTNIIKFQIWYDVLS